MRRPNGPSKRSSHLVNLPAGNTTFSAWYEKWRGWGIFVMRRPDGTQGDPVSLRQAKKESKMKRPEKAAASGLPSLTPPQESVVLAMFPTLSELLLDPNWDDGTPKGKRCLMMFIDDSATRMLVKMEGDGLKGSCVARELDEVFAVAEKLLVTGQWVWEQDQQPPPRGKKKGK
jgi:hypothetical protein